MTAKLKVFPSFAGYDSQLMALRDIGADYECVGWSEIDKWAIMAHNAVFPELADRNYGDITRIDWNAVPDYDLFTYSSPCQDFSFAGKQRGGACGSGTRSSLLWECQRAIEAKRPKFLLMENVKALVSEKFRLLFLQWEAWLRSQGYVNYTAVLNAKNYGIPQNRERVFVLSILNGNWFEFPHSVQLTKRLKDVLESEVAEKYYLSDKGSEYVFNRVGKYTDVDAEIARCITAVGNLNWTGSFVSGTATTICLNSVVDGKQPSLQDRIYSIEGISTAITTGFHPKILFKGVELFEGDGFYHKVSEKFVRKGLSGVSRTLKSETHDASVVDGGRLRRLTPRECFRLMGVSEADIDKIQTAGISETQQYKMAGNSIVKQVLMGIFRNMLRFN